MPAEYTRMFLVDNLAKEKGFFDSPNAEYNRNLFIILQSDNGRQALVCRYVDTNLKPLSKIWRIIPCGPNDKDALLDACIAFAPEFFKSCESLNKVMSNLPDTEILEVNRPEGWEELREEAREIFEKKIRMMEYPIPGKLLDSNGKYNGN
jgi:hypothetical protein